MSEPIDLHNPGRPIHVGVVLLKSTTELIDIAPVDLLRGLTPEFLESVPAHLIPKEFKAQAKEIIFHWVTETGAPGNMTPNATVNATDSFASCPPLDIVVLGATKLGYKPDDAELDFLRRSYAAASAYLTVCGGFESLLLAGLLQDKTATAPRLMLPMLRENAPGTEWVEKRYVKDGKIWTTGTVANGFDMMAAFMTETWGGEGTLAEHIIRFAAIPRRDVDYKDVPWSI